MRVRSNLQTMAFFTFNHTSRPNRTYCVGKHAKMTCMTRAICIVLNNLELVPWIVRACSHSFFVSFAHLCMAKRLFGVCECVRITEQMP